MKTGLLQKIKNVISDNDNVSDILNKILTKYPDVLIYKTAYYDGNEKTALHQLKAEVSSHLHQYEDRYFTIDRSEHPNRHSLITDDDDEVAIVNITIDDPDIGHIYFIDPRILTPSGRKIVKIGVATNIEQRMKQLSAQQFAICKLTLMKHYEVHRPFKVERALHCALDRGRVAANKELFYMDHIDKNMKMIEMIIDNFKVK